MPGRSWPLERIADCSPPWSLPSGRTSCPPCAEHRRGSPPRKRPAVSGASNQVVKARVEVLYERGLHARPASLVAQRAREFQADVALVLVESPVEISTPPGTRADAKNIMDLMFLAAPCGTQLDVEAVGADAEAAVEAILTLFEERFGIR
jgi:phosphotransferase system HPr (HPr) family protein